MAEFLNREGINNFIDKIIIQAKSEIVLVSPYLSMSSQMFEKLLKAGENNKRIIITHGKKNLNDKDKELLRKIRNIELYFNKALHSKCYFNESDLVITSMNWIEYSTKNNHEMGIGINKHSDPAIFERTIEEVNRILSESVRKSLMKRQFVDKANKNSNNNGFKKTLFRNLLDGHCIRCRVQIQFDLSKPYCKNCYFEWKKTQEVGINEKICHTCGKESCTSINKPECLDCFTY